MKKIYKYCFTEEIFLPQDSKILKAGYQHGELYLWILVDTNNENIKKYFTIYSTGQIIIGDNLVFIDTIFDGPHVWHIFEIIK